MVGELLGGLGLFAALGALALAGTALSKMDKLFNDMVQTQINPLRDRLMNVESILDEHKATLTRLEGENQKLNKVQEDTRIAIVSMNEAVEKLANSVKDVIEQNNANNVMRRRVGGQ